MYPTKIIFKSCIFNTVDLMCILKKKPKLVDFVNLLTDIEYEWDKIVIALEVEDHVLGGLNRSQDDNTEKLITVLQRWIHQAEFGMLFLMQ